MKKLLLLLSVSLMTLGNAQQFELTTENFKNIENKEQNFVVIELPGKSQSELFSKAKTFIYSKYKNLKGEGYNEVENLQIVMNVRASSGIRKVFGIETSAGDFKNTYEINFKDGKIMIKPTFVYIKQNDGSGGEKEVYLTGGNLLSKSVFDKKGKISIKQELFAGIQNKTNDFVKDLAVELSKDGSDW